MILAITGQWVAEVLLILCLFGAACIGLAMMAGDPGAPCAPRPAEQKAAERKAAERKAAERNAAAHSERGRID